MPLRKDNSSEGKIVSSWRDPKHVLATQNLSLIHHKVKHDDETLLFGRVGPKNRN